MMTAVSVGSRATNGRPVVGGVASRRANGSAWVPGASPTTKMSVTPASAAPFAASSSTPAQVMNALAFESPR